MSKSAKRPEVNRTATRRSGGATPVTGSSDVSVDTRDDEDVAMVSTADGGVGLEKPAGDAASETPVTDGAASETVTPGEDRGKKRKDKPEKELSERARRRQARKALQMGNPRWFVPVMLGLFLAGLVWIVVFYLSQMQYPIPNITYWNLGIGFGLLMLGFAMTTRWK